MGDKMDASININKDDDSDILVASSQPILPSQVSNTNKRSQPESPDTLPATKKQTGRQIRRRNSLGDLSEIGIKKAPVTKKTIADKVLEALSSPEVLNKVIPVLSEKISESISSLIEEKIQSTIDEQVKPLKEIINNQNKLIESHTQKICKQFVQIQSLESIVHQHATSLSECYKELDNMHQRILTLDDRLENQEQYSRRTSLRFHNVTVPVDHRGRVKHPVDTDELILDICNNTLGLTLTIADISRSHVIGKVRDGKTQVIVRFLSYRVRNLVYTNKKSLKDDPDGHFITENLTAYRTNLVQKLAKLKYEHKIHTYWTADGRIFAMKTEAGRRKIINNFDDIHRLEHQHETPSTAPDFQYSAASGQDDIEEQSSQN